MASTGGSSEPWDFPDFDADVAMLSSEDTLIDRAEDDDFLVMDDDDANNPSLGFLEDQGNRRESLPALYNLAPRSPSPSRSHTSAHEISPDQESQGRAHITDPCQLQVQYKRTLRKLAKSIRQSDATRSQIKRQKRLSASLSDSEDDCDFFTSRRCMELEKSRKQLLKLIAMQATCSDDKTASV